MEPTAIGTRLASAAIGPLVRKLFVTGGPGAGLVDKPIRISGYVSFKGEKRALTESDVRNLAAKLVSQALRSGERPFPNDEQQAVTDALASTLHALGDLTLTDLEAVRLGHLAFARELRRASGSPERHLTADATYFYEGLLETACLHILNFFTQRSTFVAHTLVVQVRAVDELITKVDELIRRNPLPGGEDAAFEHAYLEHVSKKHGKLTIYGIDLNNSPRQWPLNVAYLNLEASPLSGHWQGLGAMFRAGLLADDDLSALPPPQRRSFYAALSAQGTLDDLRQPGAEESPENLDSLLPFAEQASPHQGDEMHFKSDVYAARLIRVSLAAQPADQALAANHRVLLRGEAGSGKTTLVQWLAVAAAGQDLPDRMEYLYDRIPFVLPLRTLTRHGERLPAPKDFLSAIGCPLTGTQPDGWENRVLVAGRGLILIDGIDEIPDHERERTRKWLLELIETYDRDNRWLVTSRPSAVGQDWLTEDGFTELTLSPMNPPDIATFITQWHHAARIDADDAADLDEYERQLLAAVQTESDLGRLATNPLMCGLICALHRDRRGYLPHGRKDLYEAALSMLLSRRDRERDMVSPGLREEPQLDLLQRLAYWLIKNGRTEMDRSRAEEIIARALPSVPEVAALGDAPIVFEHFLQRSGLLREPAPDTVDFIHRTFQDFLGARAAVEEADFGLLVRHAADDQWEDVIRMAVALARPRERVTIFRELVDAGDHISDKRVQARVYLLATACLEYATSLEPSVRDEVEQRTATLIPPRNEEEAHALAEVGPLVLRLLPGPEELDDGVAAYNVALAASNVKSEAAIAFLSQFVRHPFLPVRSQLLWAWPRFDSARYAEEVIAHLDASALSYTIQSDEQLHHLKRLELQPEILDVRRGVSLGALASYASQHTFAQLALSNTETSDLGFLAEQMTLTSLVINDCPNLEDISAISGLPIQHLNITTTGSDISLRPVSQLPDLESLVISGPSSLSWSPEYLPSRAPLCSLRVSDGAKPLCGLQGLSDFSQLADLGLNSASSPASADDWREVGGLPALTGLSASAASFETLPPTTVLANVTSLSLSGGGGDRVVQAAVHRLPEAFPRLLSCEFTGDMTSEGDIDIAPLAQLHDLRELYIATGTDRIRGADAFSSWINLRFL
ncbi:NACHT domain-containing protein [Streptomyces turgidiscabies]|uniref:NACHT domain protein n=1 Tax=Streptomyces turgidiscabies (strain Car8) TaxID=698760 RepID=L7ERJ5_STRT8|nr:MULTISPECIES: NACHT domain-containing protein [Streptomyces]ELP61622.1 NACHT domain protein [Streptomyces turgidiscabies Car8]MDX3498705.1 NACHT domain-containing protein [Streptomyces turgidiscabies]GAQ74869.1 NACHT domain protein [Streptomyces turgidiscabies]